MSVVRDNLMNRPGYTPYCGGRSCPTMPRTRFSGQQFKCDRCGWVSGFDAEFIEQYKSKWTCTSCGGVTSHKLGCLEVPSVA